MVQTQEDDQAIHAKHKERKAMNRIHIKGVSMSNRIFMYAFMSLFLIALAACATTDTADTANRSTVVLEVPGCG
jgi:hypothetical protein